MKIEQITLSNFRNYISLDLKFNEGLNLLYGENGTGKTNLVEAIYLLTEGNSFRIKDCEKMILEGKDGFVVKGNFFDEHNHKDVEVKVAHNVKAISLNGKRLTKLSELFRENKSVCITPKDTFFFFEDPKKRRLFFDSVISKNSGEYMHAILNFNKILNERNSLLKNENINEKELEIFDDNFAYNTNIIVKHRVEMARKINDEINRVLNSICADKISLFLKYVPSIRYQENYTQKVKDLLKTEFQNDKQKGFTSHGPQKDEFCMICDGENVVNKCSNGQNKLIVIALKLCVVELLNEDGNDPILILDDVLSEIDKTNSNMLIEYLQSFKQVFITSTNKIESIPNKYLVENNRIIKEGKV